MNTNKTIGQRMRQARKAAGLSQTKAAKAIGGTRQMVSAWERDVAVPRGNHLAQVCALYGCSSQDILFGQAPAYQLPSGLALLGKIFEKVGARDPFLDVPLISKQG